MHSVDHHERCRSTAAGASSSSASPDDAPGADWSEADVPGLWTMADTWDKPHYTNVQMPFAGLPPEIPTVEPDRRLRARRSRSRRSGWSRSAHRPPRRRRRERAHRRARRRGGRRRQGLAPRLGIRPDRPRPRRAHTLGCASSSGPTRPTSRTRTSGGTAASAARSSCTRPATSTSPTSAPTPASADDLTTGTLDLTVTVGFPGRELPPGWTVETALDGNGEIADSARGDDRPDDAHGLDARDPEHHVHPRRGPPAARGRGRCGDASMPGWRRRSTVS